MNRILAKVTITNKFEAQLIINQDVCKCSNQILTVELNKLALEQSIMAQNKFLMVLLGKVQKIHQIFKFRIGVKQMVSSFDGFIFAKKKYWLTYPTENNAV